MIPKNKITSVVAGISLSGRAILGEVLYGALITTKVDVIGEKQY